MNASKMRALAGLAAAVASLTLSTATAWGGPDDTKKNPAFRAAERSQQPRKAEPPRETPRQEAPREARPAPTPPPAPAPAPRVESRNPATRAVDAARTSQERAKATPAPQARPEPPKAQERSQSDTRRQSPAPTRTTEPTRNPAFRATERASSPSKAIPSPTPAPTTTAPAPRTTPAPDAPRTTTPPTWSDRGTVQRDELPRGGGLRAAEIARRNRLPDASPVTPRPMPEAPIDATAPGRGDTRDRGPGLDRSGPRDRSNWDVTRRDRGGHDRGRRDDDRWSVSIGFHTDNFWFGYWSGDRCDPFFSRACRYDPVIWRRSWDCDPWRRHRIDRCDWRPRYRHCVDPFFSLRVDWCDSWATWATPYYCSPAPLIVTTPVVYVDPSPVYVQTFSNEIVTTGLPYAAASSPFFSDAPAPSPLPAPAPVATVYRASGDLGEMSWSAVPSGIIDAVAGALPSQRAVVAAQYLARRPAGSWQVIYEDQTSTPDGVVVRTRALNASRLGAEPAVVLVVPQLLSNVQPGAVLTVTGRLTELSIDDTSYPGGVLTLADARVGF